MILFLRYSLLSILFTSLYSIELWGATNSHPSSTVDQLTSFSRFAQIDQNDPKRDDSELLKRLLKEHDHVSIPEGVRIQIGRVDLKSKKRISGPGTISKIDSAPYALQILGKNVVIDNLSFQPQKVFGQPNCDIKLGDNAQDIQITNNHFEAESGPYSAICAANDSEATGGSEYKHHVKGVLITNNIFIGYVRPLFFHSVNNLTIQGNLIRNSIRDAIRLRENDGYVIINGNQFYDIGRDDGANQTQDAIDTCWSGLKLVITSNIVRKTASVGFDIKGKQNYEGQGSSSVVIANNHISHTANSGIVLAGNYTKKPIHTVIVESNILEHNSRIAKLGNAALWVKGSARYITIANNHIVFNRNRGITIQTNDGNFDGTVIGVKVIGNTVINNGILNDSRSCGIKIAGVEDLILTNNIISNDHTLDNPSQLNGIIISPKNTIENSIINNNIIKGHNHKMVINDRSK